MVPATVPRCNCCGQPLSDTSVGENCLHCGYPIDVQKEERFLEASLYDLQRVATYGGANITVNALIHRYRDRLLFLQHFKMKAAFVEDKVSADQTENRIQARTNGHVDIIPGKTASPNDAMEVDAPQPVSLPTVPEIASSANTRSSARMFSLKSFLEDQTINIVASLGAFLILVGSLSFVATTSDPALPFVILFIVHAIFGGVGIASYRFRNFRIVAAIYTAIFALLVPLVGFSAYRLVLGSQVHLDGFVLIAIAATYAAIVYGALAIYQRFSPFGYLSVVALVVAEFALALALHLGYWWWPCLVMLLALPSLTSVATKAGNRSFFTGSWVVLREPVTVLMFFGVVTCTVGLISSFLYARMLDAIGGSQPDNHEIRFTLVSMALLLLLWNVLFVWCTKRRSWSAAIPYLGLIGVLLFSYALDFNGIGYVLALTTVAVLYHGCNSFAARWLQSSGKLVPHMEWLALLLVSFVPFIAQPALFWQVTLTVLHPALFEFPVTGQTLMGFLAVAVGFALTLHMLFQHTGLRKVPDVAQTSWRWLLLLSGLLLGWLFGIIVLWTNSDPVWSFLGLTLALITLTVGVRRQVSAKWADPLDVLALVCAVYTLLLGDLQRANETTMFLFLLLAALSYGMLLYQGRQKLFFLPFLFALLALPSLFYRPQVLLFASIGLPLVSALVRRLVIDKSKMINEQTTSLPRSRMSTVWEWPLLATALLYGISIALYDNFATISTLQGWLHRAFPTGLEIALLAIAWYAAAVLSRVRWWLISAVGFSIIALLVPDNSFWVLTWLAPIVALLAFGVSRLAGRDWALPFYVTALFAAMLMSSMGYNQGQLPATTWALLIFALDIYLIGCAEDEPALMWGAACFASLAVYYGGLIGNWYQFFPPIVALLCAAIGVSIGCLRFMLPTFANSSLTLPASRNRLLGYALPLYATALIAALLTGVSGMALGVNKPFYTAIPDALFVYALVAYLVVLFERKAGWQWLVVGFAIWGTLLATQIPGDLTSGTCTVLCRGAVRDTMYYLSGIVVGTGVLGLLIGRLASRNAIHAKFAWNWSWYLVSLVAIGITAGWSYQAEALLPGSIILGTFCTFIAFSLVLLLVERSPEMFIVTAVLAAWTLLLVQWAIWQQMIAYSLLSVFIFATQFVWRKLPSETHWLPPIRLHALLALSCQTFVVLVIITMGGLFASVGMLAHVGAGSLLVLATLLFWYARLQTNRQLRRWCGYCAGLFLSLVVSWELSAFHQTHLGWLTLVPATYLVIVAPFLTRDETLPNHHLVGQLCSIAGAALLLLPTLWLSFSAENLQPTLILAAESLALLLLGVGVQIRFFVLSGAGLIVVAAIHVLFLPSLGIPPSLALALLGGTLLAIATALSLARHRLRAAWSHWE